MMSPIEGPRRADVSADMVSVIIPTVLRPSLRRAIASVENQTLPRAQIEIVVVVDSDGVPEELARYSEGADRLILTGGLRNGAAARNLGVGSASGKFVAFLDDDDEWLPTKLETQVRAWRARGCADAVISCRARLRILANGSESVGPERLYDGSEAVEDYLFRTRRPSPRRNAIYAPTLFCTAALARSIRWNESLRRHQDWDWVLRAHQNGALIVQLPEVGVIVDVGSSGSISASADWLSSIEWFDSVARSWNRRTQADFLVAQSLRYAIMRRSAHGVVETLKRVWRSGALPSPMSTLFAASALVPRRWAERALGVVSRAARSQPGR